MKRILAILGATLLLALTGITAAWAVSKHTSPTGSIFCGGSTASFSGFPNGTHNVTAKAYKNQTLVFTGVKSFTGTSGSVTVSFDTTGEADWAVVYSWSDDGGGTKTYSAHLGCFTSTTTTPGTTTTVIETTPAPPAQTITVTTPAPPSFAPPAPPAQTVTNTVTVEKTVVKTQIKYKTRYKTRYKIKKVKVKTQCVGKPKKIPYTP